MQITVKTYSELTQYIQLFKDNTLEILIIEGNPGIGKSSIVKEVFKDTEKQEICFIEGRISAASFYEQLYLYRDCPIIIDDSDSIYHDKQIMNILKTVCQTNTKDKRVSWHIKRKITFTDNPEVEIPSTFYTGSTVCIMCNRWKLLNTHISAIEDRGILLSFQPNNQEIHQYVSHIVKDDEILCYFKKYLHIIKNLSIRQYKICEDIKHSAIAQIQWKSIALGSWGLSSEYIQIIQLLEDERYSTMSEKALQYKLHTGRSERSFWTRVNRDLHLDI